MWRSLQESLWKDYIRHVTFLQQWKCFINKIPERARAGEARYEDQERLINHVQAAALADAISDSDRQPPLRSTNVFRLINTAASAYNGTLKAWTSSGHITETLRVVVRNCCSCAPAADLTWHFVLVWKAPVPSVTVLVFFAPSLPFTKESRSNRSISAIASLRTTPRNFSPYTKSCRYILKPTKGCRHAHRAEYIRKMVLETRQNHACMLLLLN